MMEVNGSLIINCEGSFISPQYKVIYHYFCHHLTRNYSDIYEVHAKKTHFHMRAVFGRKETRTLFKRESSQWYFLKKSDANPDGQHVDKNCSSQKEETKVKPPVTR